MAGSTQRVRAYRERQRNGVTKHRCTCGHEHYPGNAVTGTTPPGNAVTPCEACTALQARLDDMTKRLDAFATAGRQWQARAIAAESELARLQDALAREHGRSASGHAERISICAGPVARAARMANA